MDIDTLIYVLSEQVQGKYPGINIVSVNATVDRGTMILKGFTSDGTEVTEELDLY